MDEPYKPISRQELLNALVLRFGAVETARYYLSDALSDIQSIEVGVSENNQMLASKSVESLKQNLNMIRALLEKKENKGGIEKAIKDDMK